MTSQHHQQLAMDVVKSMRRQEKSYQPSTEYLMSILDVRGVATGPLHDDNIEQQHHSGHESTSNINMTHIELSNYLNWRKQMVQWCYRIAATCNFSKETVEIAVNMLDRYIALTNQPKVIMANPSCYQLACMTCLYTAAKTNEPICLSPKQMEELSGCTFGNHALEKEEKKILNTVNWRVSPPTGIAFARNLLDSVEPQLLESKFGITPNDVDIILNTVETQIEHSNEDELFLPIRTSGIALAAVLNATQGYLQSATCRTQFQAVLFKVLGYGEFHKSCSRRREKIHKLQTALFNLCPGLCDIAIVDEATSVIHYDVYDMVDCTAASKHESSYSSSSSSSGHNKSRAAYSPKSVTTTHHHQ